MPSHDVLNMDASLVKLPTRINLNEAKKSMLTRWILITVSLLVLSFAFAANALAIHPFGKLTLPTSEFFMGSIKKRQKQYDDWQLIGVNGGILSYKRNIPGSKLLGFRGVMEIDMHISKAIAPFMDLNLAYQWIDLLSNIVAIPMEGSVDLNNKKSYSSSSSSSSSSPPSAASASSLSLRNKLGIFFKKKLPGIGDAESKKVAETTSNNINDNNKNSNYNQNNNNYKVPPPTKKGTKSSVEKACRGEYSTDLIYEEFKLPWPMSPREILLQREWCYDKADGSVVVRYHSVEDERVPVRPGNVRSISPHTLWRFQDSNKVTGRLQEALDIARRGNRGIKNRCNGHGHSNNEGVVDKASVTRRGWAAMFGGGEDRNSDTNMCTVLEIECVVDPRGSIPAWFINYMQRLWPSQALASYERILRRNLAKPSSKLIGW